MLEIILGIVVFISILLIIIILINNKFKLAIIKIDKAQEDISLYLQKKEELLNRTKPIIKKELKLISFPSNVVAFFGRYKKKSFYNNEKRDITDIKEY